MENAAVMEVNKEKQQDGDVAIASETTTNAQKIEANDFPHNDEQQQENDEFSYLQRNEFTSEIYKIEVKNLGFFGIGEFKKLLKNKLQLDMSKIKSPKRRDFAFVCFRSQADQERAISTLNGYKWKGKTLQAFAAKASADPLMKRRNEEQQQNNESTNAKKPRSSAEAACPLASLSYDAQMVQKTTEMETILKSFTDKLQRTNPASKNYLKKFKLEGVYPSPQVNGYRNKNEFTIGKNAAEEIVVGFRLGSYADGSVEVDEVQNLPHIPEASKWAAKSFQEFVRASKFLPFNPVGNAGHFRQLMVRTSAATDEIMIAPGIYSSNLSEPELAELKADLKKFYENYVHPEFKCTSLYYQDVKPREAGQTVSPVEHLYGTKYITDVIHGLKFRIGPLAFFQNNTHAAGVLYQKAIDLATPQLTSTVLDICCGTGTIALCFAKHCKQVMGVEIIEEAIKDAEFNAKENGIENCKFFTGNADHYIQSMVREIVYGNPTNVPLDLIAVIDPPRSGLHNRSIAAIRAATVIKRLIYIACDANRAQHNFIELGRAESKQYKGEPFFPKTALGVDLFPHTKHIELVLLFERAGSEDDHQLSAKQEGENHVNKVSENMTVDGADENKKTDGSGLQENSLIDGAAVVEE